MASGRFGPALGQVGRLFGPAGTATALAGRSLLERFARHRDEAAFEALVARHGPMVLGVCRRALDQPDDVEDAFQATFLVLARRAGSIRDGDRLGPWLHGVARRVAARAQARAFALRSREGAPLPEPPVSIDPGSDLEADELRSTLDDELGRLPEKYRVPLVLCYLEGLTHDEAAAHLGWPVGTVRSRLSGGRDRLRARLTRRGLAPSAGLAGILPATPIPESLISTTARLATAVGTSIPTQVATLAKGALVAMMLDKFMTAAAIGLTASLLAGSAGALARQGGTKEDASPTTAAVQKPSDVNEATGAPPEGARSPSERLNAHVGALREELDVARRRVARLEHELADLKATTDTPDIPRPDPEKKLTSPTAQPAEGAAKADPAKPTSSRPAPKARMGGMGSGMGTMGGGMAGMGGGMGGMATAQPGQPMTVALGGGKILSISTARDRATIHDLRENSKVTYQLPKNLTNVTVILGPDVVTLEFEGPKIDQIVAISNGFWHLQELREPVTGHLLPVVGQGMVTFQAGRLLYIFSNSTLAWSVLELE